MQTLSQKKCPIVVILGMHRSGTSLAANFVHAIGVDMGDDLLSADEWNTEGYWESQYIFQTHEKILRQLDCDWHNPPFSFPSDWQRKPGIQQLRNDLANFVRSECERTKRIWGFKDPRTAILLPMWQGIFDELLLEPYYILTVRHPGSVAASLKKRDDLGLSHSQVLWLKSNLDMLSHTGNNRRAIVDYDRWFDSGLEQARTVVNSLGFSKDVDEIRVAEAVSQVIRPGMRHHSSKGEIICSPIVAKFYSLLRQAATDGKIPDEISEITRVFEKSRELLNIWDQLVIERDATIAKRDIRIKRLRKQKKALVYVAFSALAILLMMSSLVLTGWFK